MSNIVPIDKSHETVEKIIDHVVEVSDDISAIFIVVFKKDKKSIEYAGSGSFTEACTAAVLLNDYALRGEET